MLLLLLFQILLALVLMLVGEFQNLNRISAVTLVVVPVLDFPAALGSISAQNAALFGHLLFLGAYV